MEGLVKINALSNLYMIRAGISAISIKKGKVDEFKRLCNEKQSPLLAEKNRLLNKIEQNKKDIEKEEAYLSRKVAGVKVENFFLILVSIILFAAVVATGILLVGHALGWGKGFFNGQDINEEAGGAFFGWILLCIAWLLCGVLGLLVGLFGVVIKSELDYNSFWIWEKKKAPENIARLKKENRECVAKIKEINKMIQDLDEEYEIKAYPVVNESKLFFNALQRAYAKVIDVRDWKHIDLIIFYFETGRAETLKEALQQVDNQIQSDNIVKALGYAIRELKQTILFSASKLADIMGKGMMLLSNQLSSLQAQIGEQNQIVSQLVNTKSMTVALQEKSDSSSTRLMEDVHYMRTIVEGMEVRRRNNQ